MRAVNWFRIYTRLLVLSSIIVLAPAGKAQTPIATGLDVPFNLRVDGDNLYFVNVTPNTNYGDVETVPITGGTPISIIPAETSDLLINGQFIYAGEKTGTIVRMPLSGGPVTPFVSRNGAGPILGALGSDIYYANGSFSIDKTPVSGGQATSVITGVWARQGTMDSTGIYFDDYTSNSIQKYDFSTNAVSPFAPAQPGGNDKVSIDSQNAYIKLAGGGIQVLPKTGGTPQTLVTGNVAYSPYTPDSSSGYLVNNGYVYYSDGDAIKRISSSGGTAIKMATIVPGSVTGMASDGQKLYWGVSTGNAGAGELKQIALPPPTQNIVLDFDHPAPFTIVEKKRHSFWGDTIDVFSPESTTPVADFGSDPLMSAKFKSDILERVKRIFSEAGITNINITDAPSSSPASRIYFTSPVNRPSLIAGIGDVDRFNSSLENKAIVYLDGFTARNCLPPPRAVQA